MQSTALTIIKALKLSRKYIGLFVSEMGGCKIKNS
jgi:hypothetical protein